MCGADITMLNPIGFFVEGCPIWRVHVVLVGSFSSQRGGEVLTLKNCIDTGVRKM